jgi:hypothetical protein
MIKILIYIQDRISKLFKSSVGLVRFRFRVYGVGFFDINKLINFFKDSIGGRGICSFHMESSVGSNRFPEFGKVDIHSKLFQMDVDGIEQLQTVILSEGHFFIDLPINLLASFCHFLNQLPSIILKIVRFENTIVNELNRLLNGVDWSSLWFIFLRFRYLLLFLCETFFEFLFYFDLITCKLCLFFKDGLISYIFSIESFLVELVHH